MPRCLFLILIISSISCGDGGSVLIVIGCRLVLPRCSLFSSDAAIVRWAEGVASHPSSVSFSYELGKTARNVISRSSSSDVLGLLVPHSLRSSRLVVSWGVSCRIVVVVVARGGCRGLAVLLVGVSSWRSVIRLSCGVAVCLPSSFACRLVRFSSFRLVWRLVACSPMSCWLGRRGVLARLIVVVAGHGAGSYCRA